MRYAENTDKEKCDVFLCCKKLYTFKQQHFYNFSSNYPLYSYKQKKT